jgi:hypothetical protein
MPWGERIATVAYAFTEVTGAARSRWVMREAVLRLLLGRSCCVSPAAVALLPYPSTTPSSPAADLLAVVLRLAPLILTVAVTAGAWRERSRESHGG